MLFTMRSKCLAWQSLSMVRNWPLPTKTCWMFLTRIATEMSSATVKTASLSSGYDCPHFAGWYIISTFNFHFRPLALPRKSRETARSRFARCIRWTGSESLSTCRANPTRCPVTLSKCWTSFSSHKSAKMSRKFFFLGLKILWWRFKCSNILSVSAKREWWFPAVPMCAWISLFWPRAVKFGTASTNQLESPAGKLSLAMSTIWHWILIVSFNLCQVESYRLFSFLHPSHAGGKNLWSSWKGRRKRRR